MFHNGGIVVSVSDDAKLKAVEAGCCHRITSASGAAHVADLIQLCSSALSNNDMPICQEVGLFVWWSFRLHLTQ